MKKITLLALAVLSLFTATFGASSKNTVKDLPFLTKSFTSYLFDTIPESHVSIVSLDYTGWVKISTPPNPLEVTFQVTPYNTASRYWFTGNTNISFHDNSTLPFYVRISTSAWSSWWQVTEDDFEIPNIYFSSSFPVTIKIGTDLSLLTWDL